MSLICHLLLYWIKKTAHECLPWQSIHSMLIHETTTLSLLAYKLWLKTWHYLIWFNSCRLLASSCRYDKNSWSQVSTLIIWILQVQWMKIEIKGWNKIFQYDGETNKLHEKKFGPRDRSIMDVKIPNNSHCNIPD